MLCVFCLCFLCLVRCLLYVFAVFILLGLLFRVNLRVRTFVFCGRWWFCVFRWCFFRFMVWGLAPETVRKFSSCQVVSCFGFVLSFLGFSSTSLLFSRISGFCQGILSLFRAFVFSFCVFLFLSPPIFGAGPGPLLLLPAGVRRRKAGAMLHSVRLLFLRFLCARAGSPLPLPLSILSSLCLVFFFLSFSLLHAGGWLPGIHSNAVYLSFDVGSSHHCIAVLDRVCVRTVNAWPIAPLG